MADLEQPSAWVRRFCSLVGPGEMLDLACGSGRHARLLAAAGHPVLAVDRDPAALAAVAGNGITARQIDLEGGNGSDLAWLFGAPRFSAVIVTNYLYRPLFPQILASLAPGGVLIYETFAAGNARFGKPSNPDFLLRPGELLNLVLASAAGPFRIIAYEDGFVDSPRPAMLQRICAAKAGLDAAPDRLRLN